MPAFMIILPTSPAAPAASAHQVGQGGIALAHGQAQIAVAQTGVHLAELFFLFHKTGCPRWQTDRALGQTGSFPYSFLLNSWIGSAQVQLFLADKGGVDGVIHVVLHLVVHLADGDGGAGHLHRGGILAHNGPIDLDALGGQDLAVTSLDRMYSSSTEVAPRPLISRSTSSPAATGISPSRVFRDSSASSVGGLHGAVPHAGLAVDAHAHGHLCSHPG